MYINESGYEHEPCEECEEMVSDAEEKRAKLEYEKAYETEYERAYAEEYSKLIVDSDITVYAAQQDAKDYAEEQAKEAAKEAVKEFWKEVR